MAHFLEFTNNPFKKTLLSKRKKKSVLLSSDFALDITLIHRAQLSLWQSSLTKLTHPEKMSLFHLKYQCQALHRRYQYWGKFKRAFSAPPRLEFRTLQFPLKWEYLESIHLQRYQTHTLSFYGFTIAKPLRFLKNPI